MFEWSKVLFFEINKNLELYVFFRNGNVESRVQVSLPSDLDSAEPTVVQCIASNR